MDRVRGQDTAELLLRGGIADEVIIVALVDHQNLTAAEAIDALRAAKAVVRGEMLEDR